MKHLNLGICNCWYILCCGEWEEGADRIIGTHMNQPTENPKEILKPIKVGLFKKQFNVNKKAQLSPGKMCFQDMAIFPVKNVHVFYLALFNPKVENVCLALHFPNSVGRKP